MKYIFRLIILILGWNLIDKETYKIIKSKKKVITVFSHTTYFDFYIFVLYKLAYPGMLKHTKIVVKPQPFRYAGFILRYLGAIPSTPVDQKKGGNVKHIVDELSKMECFNLLICPKGTIIKKDWRTGYYYIAKTLNVPIIVGGMDYEFKKIIMFDIEQNDNIIETEKNIKYYLSDIVPLYPECEVVEIRKHSQRSAIKYINIFYLLCIFTIINFVIQKMFL